MKDDAFIIILILLASLLFFTLFIFGLGSYIIKYFTKKQIATKIYLLLFSAQPYLLLLFLIAFLIYVLLSFNHYSKYFLPYPLSYEGIKIVPLFNVTTIVTGIAFFITQILLFYFSFKYRVKINRKAMFLKNFMKLEILWTTVVGVTFLFLFLWGQILWSMIISEPEENSTEIEVVAQQFSWWLRYAGADKKFGRVRFAFISNTNVVGIDPSDPNGEDDFMPVQIHVIKNKTVKIRLRSKDVIHSFFVPYFRIKMDAIPGMITKIHFTPTTSTAEMRKKLNDPEFNYEVACAELCGRMHFAMKLILVVDEPAQFEQWQQEQSINTLKHAELVRYDN